MRRVTAIVIATALLNLGGASAWAIDSDSGADPGRGDAVDGERGPQSAGRPGAGREGRRAMREQMRAYRDGLPPAQQELLQRRRHDPASLSGEERNQLRGIMEGFRESFTPEQRERFDRARGRGAPGRGQLGPLGREGAAGAGGIDRQALRRGFADSLDEEDRDLLRRMAERDPDVTPGDRQRIRERMRAYRQTLSPEERRAMRGGVGRDAERRRRLRELPPAERRALRQQWGELTPEERRRVREELRAVRPDQRRELEGRLREFRDQPEQDQELLRERYYDLRGYSQRDRRRIDENARRWQGMTREQRERLRGQMERLRAMPPEERSALIDRLLGEAERPD